MFTEDRSHGLHLERIDGARNTWRYYALSIGDNLFGEIELTRRWGRIGTFGREMRMVYQDRVSAIEALVTTAQAKKRRGYRSS